MLSVHFGTRVDGPHREWHLFFFDLNSDGCYASFKDMGGREMETCGSWGFKRYLVKKERMCRFHSVIGRAADLSQHFFK